MLSYGLVGMDETALFYSVLSACIHTFIEICIFILESKAVKSSILKYAV